MFKFKSTESLGMVFAVIAYFSFSLLGMTLLTIIGIPSALYLIAKPPLLRHWFVAQDENGNRLHIYRDSHKDLDLEGR